jgi:hypothetical protein
MKCFTKTINGIDFNFQPILEGEDEVCKVHVENHSFKMTTDDKGNWQIRQQVPNWIKQLEQDLANTIDNEEII